MVVLVECASVKAGLVGDEVTVGVKTLKGNVEYLRSASDAIVDSGGKQYLEVAVVHQEQDSRNILIEFPLEADSGANRAWVGASSVIAQRAIRAAG